MIDLNNTIIDLVKVQSAVLVFVRVVAIIWLAPIFGSSSIPNTVKSGFALLVSFIAYPFVDFSNVVFIETIFGLLLAIVKEAVIGMIIGYVSIMMFSAVRLTGQLLGRQMGFAIANVVDPLTNEQMSVVAHMLYFVTVLTFLGTNMHHYFIKAIIRSLEVISLGGFSPDGAMMEYIIKLTSNLFVVAIKLGAPLISILLVVSAAMGIVAKTVPQLNILIAGMPIRIGVGLVGFLIMVPVYTGVLQDFFVIMVRDLETIIRLMV